MHRCPYCHFLFDTAAQLAGHITFHTGSVIYDITVTE